MLEWLRENGPPTCAIEIKVAKGGKVRKKALLPHQLRALLGVWSGRALVHKLSDESRRQQPFDAFKLSYTPAYVVCVFLTGGPRVALMIDAREWAGATRDTPAAYTIPL